MEFIFDIFFKILGQKGTAFFSLGALTAAWVAHVRNVKKIEKNVTDLDEKLSKNILVLSTSIKSLEASIKTEILQLNNRLYYIEGHLGLKKKEEDLK